MVRKDYGEEVEGMHLQEDYITKDDIRDYFDQLAVCSGLVLPGFPSIFSSHIVVLGELIGSHFIS